jgi:hypothetical protein
MLGNNVTDRDLAPKSTACDAHAQRINNLFSLNVCIASRFDVKSHKRNEETV